MKHSIRTINFKLQLWKPLKNDHLNYEKNIAVYQYLWYLHTLFIFGIVRDSLIFNDISILASST
jgi:hypothetical protein